MNFKSTFLPHIIAISIFLVLSVSFFGPIVFNGKGLGQHDILQAAGANQEIIDYRSETGEELLWTNSMFSGMPTYLINLKWSGDLLRYVASVYSLWLPSPVDTSFIAMISFYILLLVFGVRPYLAIAGAVAFGLSTFNIISIEAGHIWKVRAIAYMPLVLAGVHLLFTRRYLVGFILSALAIALQIRSNHFQISYYLFLMLLVYGVSTAIILTRQKRVQELLKITGLVAAAGLLAIACNLGRIWTTYEYGSYSIRGKSELTSTGDDGSKGLDKEYAFRWSNGIFEPLTLLVPDFYGGPSQQSIDSDSHLGEALGRNGMAPVQVRQQLEQVPTYWGDQPGVAGPVYAGAIICCLAILGFMLLDNKYRYWLGAAILLSLALSWGKNFETFNYLMFDYFPGYNKFRAVTMVIVIALLGIPLAGFLGLEKLLQNQSNQEFQKKFLLAGGIVSGVLLLLILFAGMLSYKGSVDGTALAQLPSWYIDALRSDRQALMRGDALRSLIFILLAWGAIYLYLKQRLSETLMITLIILLVTADLWLVNKRYVDSDDFKATPEKSFAQQTEADQVILGDEEAGYRVLNLQNPWSEARTSYYHHSLGGYHGAKLRRYQDFIEQCLSPEIQNFIGVLQSGSIDASGLHTISMLNTKYILAGTSKEAVIKNPNNWGTAWFVKEVLPVSSADEEIQATCQITSQETAVINTSRWPLSSNEFSTNGSIDLVEYRPNYSKYQVETTADGLAVFSEIYYPAGWRALIDGEETTIMQANYLLRALMVPSGKHTIEFEFVPGSYFVGNKIMMVASILLILMGCYTVYRTVIADQDKQAA